MFVWTDMLALIVTKWKNGVKVVHPCVARATQHWRLVNATVGILVQVVTKWKNGVKVAHRLVADATQHQRLVNATMGL